MKKAIVVSYIINEDEKQVMQKIRFVDAPKKDNLKFLYERIGCDMIDCVYADGFDIWVDDEGLLKSGNVVVAYDFGTDVVNLAGNLVISKSADAEGNTVWFDEAVDYRAMWDIQELMEKGELKGVVR